MSGGRKNKKQYVEHYEEHVGAEMKPFVVYTVEEKPKENNANPVAHQSPINSNTNSNGKRRWWRKLTAFFG